MKIASSVWSGLLLVATSVLGCSQPSEDAPSAASSSAPTQPDSQYLLQSEPPKAEEVIAARKTAQDDDEVVVVGRIGGSETPWVDGRAVFTIVDPSLKACSDMPGDNCPHPWDYCCETDKLPEASALVKIVDQEGNVVKSDARNLLSVKELQTVVVKGKAQRDETGNLTILANGVFVKE